MEIRETKTLCQGKVNIKGVDRVFLSLFERQVEHNGKISPYFLASRSVHVPLAKDKLPDAVVIVAIKKTLWPSDTGGPYQPARLVLVDEFRPAIGRREICFPAGLIDQKDYEGGKTAQEAAKSAAVRELKEETGLTLTVTGVSPPNLYSSAGMSDESCMIVFGKAEGEISSAFMEADEDIKGLLWSEAEIATNIHNPDLAFAKVCWPFLWNFARNGLWL